MPDPAQPPQHFHKKWSLPECRQATQLDPAPHQALALRKLDTWYTLLGKNGGGGILVLPTGGGKTITAVRFLCNGPLSDGYKVLWLAHTHHLLEQAFHSFRDNTLGSIREPKRELSLRIVSGTPGHFPPRDIRQDDDVVIATLQTVTNAHREKLAALMSFLGAAGQKLFIVFDEAHHAPAPSYRKLIQELQASSAPILGLTATPVYSDETKQGWLKKLFPDGILAQARAADLIAAGVLAQPIPQTLKTAYAPKFEAADYEKWLGTYHDIPEYIVDDLAKNAERNGFIAKAYADNQTEWGKTIIFTDRWYQCEMIAEALAKHGIKAGSVYSHVDASLATVAERRKRDRDENARVLARFRNGEIKVLINVRMLTEGTDVPDAQTVLITRQTTSRILLTQMVGRALRGPKFGGTATANIVSFEDDWRQQIQWADFELGGGIDEGWSPPAKRPPLQLISIDLVKKLARQMNGGVNIATAPFQTMLPLGWYRTTFVTRADGGDDIEEQDLLVMVYADERDAFESLIKSMIASVPELLANEGATFDEHRTQLGAWRNQCFDGAKRHASELEVDIFQIARHVAQRRVAPVFFPFEVRAEHDLDKLAIDIIDRDLGPRAVDGLLRAEYAREDRFWRTLFQRYEQLAHFTQGCIARILGERAGHPPPITVPPADTSTLSSASEPTEEVKAEVKKRDNHACLACSSVKNLQVDHIVAVYHGGSSDPGNLQTLCRRCNQLKSTRTIRFTSASTQLAAPRAVLLDFDLPGADDAANPEQWEKFLRRTINFFFDCGAVAEVQIAGRGEGYYNWTVTLRSGNQPAWLAPHVGGLLERIQKVRETGRKPPIKSLRVVAPGCKELMIRS